MRAAVVLQEPTRLLPSPAGNPILAYLKARERFFLHPYADALSSSKSFGVIFGGKAEIWGQLPLSSVELPLNIRLWLALINVLF